MADNVHVARNDTSLRDDTSALKALPEPQELQENGVRETEIE